MPERAQQRLKLFQLVKLAAACLVLVATPCFTGSQSPQVVEVLADHDSRFKIAGEREPIITVHAGAPLTLRITAVKAKNRNRDGSIHGFALLRAKDRSKVPGWDFLLKPGLQEITVTAPEAGNYVVVCTVICSDNHDGMSMKFIVLP